MSPIEKEKIEKLKEIIKKCYGKYKEDWKKHEDKLFKEIERIKEELRKCDPKEVDIKNVKKWLESLNKIAGPSFFYFGEEKKRAIKALRRILGDFKKNEKTQDYEILKKYRDEKIPSGAGFWTSILSILHKENYFPLGEKTLEKLEKEEIIKRFWGTETKSPSLEKGVEFFNVLKKINEELGIKTMLETGYYLYKYNKEKKEEKSEEENKLYLILRAIQTKPFCILAGVSGTGKTQIARIIANVMSSDKDEKEKEELEKYISKNYISDNLIILKKDWEKEIGKSERVGFVPVRPDWNEPKKMWGYYNPLRGLFYPTDALKVILHAWRELVKDPESGKNKKHFIILDEMNLARVEYYMSDLLSLMENMSKVDEGKIKIGEMAMIHNLSRCVFSKLPEKIENFERYVKEENGEIKWKIEGEKYCQEKCEECPYFALKERKNEQNKIEKDKEEFIKQFEPIPPRIVYPENLVIIGTVNVDETTFSFSPKVLDRAFVFCFTEVDVENYCTVYGINDEEFKKFVKDLINILKPANLHFGYRVINEMYNYYIKNKNPNDFDFLIKSKVLPKIHGTEEEVKEVLLKLLRYCLVNEGVKEDGEKIDLEEIEKEVEGKESPFSQEVRYKESFEKILEMYRRLKERGYCSYF